MSVRSVRGFRSSRSGRSPLSRRSGRSLSDRSGRSRRSARSRSSFDLTWNNLSKDTVSFLAVPRVSFTTGAEEASGVIETCAHASFSLSVTPSPAFLGGGRVGRAASLASLWRLNSSKETPSGSSTLGFSSTAAASAATSPEAAGAPSSVCSALASSFTSCSASSSTLGSFSFPQLAPPAPDFLFSLGPRPVPDRRS